MPPERDEPVIGKMLWFNASKGFGCISTADDERLRVDQSGFQPGEAPTGRCGGRGVVFDLAADGDEVLAVNVRFAADGTARRARRRAGSRPR